MTLIELLNRRKVRGFLLVDLCAYFCMNTRGKSVTKRLIWEYIEDIREQENDPRFFEGNLRMIPVRYLRKLGNKMMRSVEFKMYEPNITPRFYDLMTGLMPQPVTQAVQTQIVQLKPNDRVSALNLVVDKLTTIEKKVDNLVNGSSRQSNIVEIGTKVFGEASMVSTQERLMRFTEEAFEVMQAAGLPLTEVLRMAAHVYERKIGELSQELAGTSVTLHALADAHKIDLEEVTDKEISRVWTDRERIWEKIKGKPDSIFAVRPKTQE
jgi:hypothetical protein